MQLSRLAISLSFSVLLAAPASGAVLIDVNGPNGINTASTSLGNNLAVGFSLPSAHTNVSVIVSLITFDVFGGDSINLQAYLTTQLGPGTNAASHEVASLVGPVTLTESPLSPPYSITQLTVFSGLNLAAGSYFLNLYGTFLTNNGFWISSPNLELSVVTAPGVTVTNAYMQGPGVDPYPPASSFADLSPTIGGLWFQVTGDPVTGVPEPSTLVLTGLAVAIFALRRRHLRS